MDEMGLKSKCEHGSKFARDERGMAVMLSLAVLAVVSALVFGAVQWVQSAQKSVDQRIMRDAIRIFLLNLKGRVNNDAAWASTYNHSSNASSFACLLNPAANCCGQPQQPFGVYSESGLVYYDARSSAVLGFDYSGEVCTTFNATSGDNSCPFRATVQWTPANAGFSPSCKDVMVQVTFDYKPSSGSTPLRGDNVPGSTFIRGGSDGSLALHCLASGGVFDQTSNACTLKAAITNCPNGQFMKGIDAQGNAVCAPVTSTLSGPDNCPTGQAITSVSLAGTMPGTKGCTPFPLPPPCLVNYHMEGNYCYYNFRGPCPVANGSGQNAWNGTGYSCQAVSCSPTFVLVSGACVCPAATHVEPTGCVANVRTCSGSCGAGSGEQVWSASGWGACTDLPWCTTGAPPPSSDGGGDGDGGGG